MPQESKEVEKKSSQPDGPNSFGHQWFKENRGKKIRVRLSNGTPLKGELTRWDKYKFGLSINGKVFLVNQSNVSFWEPLDGGDSDDK